MELRSLILFLNRKRKNSVDQSFVECGSKFLGKVSRHVLGAHDQALGCTCELEKHEASLFRYTYIPD